MVRSGTSGAEGGMGALSNRVMGLTGAEDVLDVSEDEAMERAFGGEMGNGAPLEIGGRRRDDGAPTKVLEL